MQKLMPTLLAKNTRNGFNTKEVFTKDFVKCTQQITLKNFPNVVPLIYLIREVVVGKIYSADLYSLVAEQFFDAVYGATLEVRPSGIIGLILKIDTKFVYAALLHKIPGLKAGDFVVLKDLSVDVHDPFDLLGTVGSSKLIEKLSVIK